MRIAIFTDTYSPEINGVAVSSASLIKILKERGHDVFLVTTNHFEKKTIYDKKNKILHLPGMRLKAIFDSRLVNPWVFSLIYKTRKVMKNFRPDVIHLQTEWGVALLGKKVALKYNIPYVYTFHTMYEDYASYVTGRYFNRASRAILRWHFRHITDNSIDIISPSLKTKDYLRSIGINNYINVVPTGIDFSKFKKDNIGNEHIKKIKHKLNIDEDSKIFLILGRLAKEKNIDISIKMYAKFKEKYPNIKSNLLIVGGGPIFSELVALCEHLNIINETRFIGPVANEEVPLYYQVSDIYCSSSITETQGLTYMEAMASSLILLVRYDYNLLDVIKDNETGFCFHNEDEFVSKAFNILNSSKIELDKIRKNAIKFIDSYSMETFYKRILKVYEKAIRKHY